MCLILNKNGDCNKTKRKFKHCSRKTLVFRKDRNKIRNGKRESEREWSGCDRNVACLLIVFDISHPLIDPSGVGFGWTLAESNWGPRGHTASNVSSTSLETSQGAHVQTTSERHIFDRATPGGSQMKPNKENLKKRVRKKRI